MLKKLRMAAALVAAGLTLGACSSATEADPNEPVTLTFSTYHWLEKGRGDVMWEVIKKYTDTHPNVTIEQQSMSRAEYEKTLSTQIGAGAGPDLMHLPDPYFFELQDAGALLPLDGVLDEAQKATLTTSNEVYNVDGEQYAYVWEVAGYGFFYNKDVLAAAGVEVPTNFDELVKAAQTIKAKTGKTGIASRHLMNEEAAWFGDHFAWPYGVGGGWSDGSKLTINSPENVKAETLFKELYSSGAFAVGDDSATFREKFKQGQIGMLIDNAGPMVSLTRNNPVVPPTSVGSAPVPFPSQGTQAIGGGLGINANTKHPEAAKEFLKWMYTPETQSALAEGMFPSLVGTDIPVPQHLMEQYPWFGSIYDGLRKTNPRPIVIEGFELQTPKIRTIILTQIERMLTQDVDPQEALDQAQEEAERAVSP